MTRWQKELVNWKNDFFLYGSQPDGLVGTPDEIRKVTEYMQEHFPGPYKIQYKFNTKILSFEFVPVFDDPNDEMFWMVKYS